MPNNYLMPHSTKDGRSLAVLQEFLERVTNHQSHNDGLPGTGLDWRNYSPEEIAALLGISSFAGSSVSALTTNELAATLDLKDTVERHFPGAWRLVETALSAVNTLRLEDVADATAVILEGPPASSKTTVLSFFDLKVFPFYRSDKFTPAAFVSHHAGTSKKDLAAVDLLPRIRLKALVTPELAPMFRGRTDDLIERFSTLTRVLDGQGLMTDSGVHGQRGYAGDYTFVWLGATTPFQQTAWEIMAHLGSRLFFLPVPDEPATDDALRSILRGSEDFSSKVEACRNATTRLVEEVLPNESAVRAVRWDRTITPDDVVEPLTHLARLLVHLRGLVPVVSRGPGNRPEFGPPVIEKEFRALSVLFNIARGHALLYGRRYLIPADAALVVPIALGSCPNHRRRLFEKLLQSGGRITVSMGADALQVAHETARSYLHEFERLRLVEVRQLGQVQEFMLAHRWQWFLSLEFKHLQSGPLAMF